MEIKNNQVFDFKEKKLEFETDKSILLCRNSKTNRNIWARRINDVNSIEDAIDDRDTFYLNCIKDEKSGQFIALHKSSGETAWLIPGRSFLQLLFDNFLYIIFIDEKDKFFLIKVDKVTGSKLWFHEVDSDLSEYSIRQDRIMLKYGSGKTDRLSPATGKKI